MPSPIRVVAAGQVLAEHMPTGRALDEMLKIGAAAGAADVVFCNLEVAVRTAAPSWPMKERVVHTAPVEILDLLAKMGVTALSLANNHVGDMGPAAVARLLEEVDARGFLHAGAGRNAGEAARVRYWRDIGLVAAFAGPTPLPGRALDPSPSLPARPGVNGLAVERTVQADAESFAAMRRLLDSTGHTGRMEREVASGRKRHHGGEALDFYGTVVQLGQDSRELAQASPGDAARLLDGIRHAAESGVRSLVSIHYHDWEPDWSVPPGWFTNLAHECIDAGAFAVIGHGPPVAAGIEVYRGGLIAYGLGNLVFHTHRRGGYPQPEVWSGHLLEASFDGDRSLTNARILPVRIERSADGHPMFPRLATLDEATQIVARVAALSSPYGTSVRPRADGTGDLEW